MHLFITLWEAKNNKWKKIILSNLLFFNYKVFKTPKLSCLKDINKITEVIYIPKTICLVSKFSCSEFAN